MPLVDSGMRVMELLAWPNTIIALTLSLCSTWSLGSSTASNQRVSGMPGVSIIFFGCSSDRTGAWIQL